MDNVQWLDAVSAEVLTAVARRVYAEGIAGLFAVRKPAGRRLPLDALTELFLPQAARPGCPCLLALVAGGRLDDGIAARLVTETRGNLLALIELRGELTEVCVPRIPSMALTSRVAPRASGGDDHRSCACGSSSS